MAMEKWDKKGNLITSFVNANTWRGIDYIGDGYFLGTDANFNVRYWTNRHNKESYIKLLQTGAFSLYGRGIKYDGKYIWVGMHAALAGNYTLRQIDWKGKTIFISATFSVNNPYGLEFDGKYFYFGGATTDLIYKVTRAGKIIDTFPVAYTDIHDFCYDGKHLWAISYNATDKTKLTAYNIITGKPVKVISNAGVYNVLATDGKYFYVSP